MKFATSSLMGRTDPGALFMWVTSPIGDWERHIAHISSLPADNANRSSFVLMFRTLISSANPRFLHMQ
jgi:hypothetical protein